ncbi:MAG TPA: hypothetical protein VF989_05335 [Polyangiaceae bacterium]|jgi:hypothetical protein
MAATKQKSAKQTKFGEKARFVRTLPPGTPAKEVVAAAKKKGITISENYVYNLRSNDGMAQKRGGKGRARAGAVRSTGSESAQEAQFRKAVAELGLSKAREILRSVEAAFGGR